MLYALGLALVFFFKQKTAYEMRISDWSSDVCSSDLRAARRHVGEHVADRAVLIVGFLIGEAVGEGGVGGVLRKQLARTKRALRRGREQFARDLADALLHPRLAPDRKSTRLNSSH